MLYKLPGEDEFPCLVKRFALAFHAADGLHPDASGYRIWADAMEPLLTKLLGGG